MNSIFTRWRAHLRWVPSLGLALAIFFFSATPGEEVHESYHNLEVNVQTISPQLPITDPAGAENSITVDWLKTAHGIGYFGLGLSVLYSLSMRSRWSPSAAFIICTLYSFTDEFHQMFIPERSASPKDILLDTLASLMGVAVMLGLAATKRFFRRKE